MPAYKISSFEANYHELIIECLKTKNQLFLLDYVVKMK